MNSCGTRCWHGRSSTRCRCSCIYKKSVSGVISSFERDPDHHVAKASSSTNKAGPSRAQIVKLLQNAVRPRFQCLRCLLPRRLGDHPRLLTLHLNTFLQRPVELHRIAQFPLQLAPLLLKCARRVPVVSNFTLANITTTSCDETSQSSCELRPSAIGRDSHLGSDNFFLDAAVLMQKRASSLFQLHSFFIAPLPDDLL